MAISGTTREDGRDNNLHPPDPEHMDKDNVAAGAAAPPSLALVLTEQDSVAAVRAPASPAKKGVRFAVAKKVAATRRLSKLSTAAATIKSSFQNLRRAVGLKRMSSANGSDAGSQPRSPMSLGSNVQSQSISGSQPESSNNSEPIPIEIDDDTDEIDDEEGVILAGSKRKLTSAVWKEFRKVEVGGTVRAKCNYCSKKLSAVSKNETNHLRVHLKSCVQKKIKLNGKTFSQASLRFDKTDAETVSVENYTFDQDIARQEPSAMIELHEYPLSMVDHVGFLRFVGALQPLFKIGTRNTISTSGRVLSEHRSRLTSKMSEALMCSQDWLHNKYKVDEKNKKAATLWSCLQDIQEGLQELAL